MKIVIWGIGIIGKRLFNILPKDSIVAIIDQNEELHDKYFHEIPIIPFNTYKQELLDFPILVTPLNNDEIIKALNEANVDQYWLLHQEPLDMYSTDERPLHKIFNDSFSDIGVEGIAIIGGTIFSIFLHQYLSKNNTEIQYILPDDDYYLSKYDSVDNREQIKDIDFALYKKVLICNREFRTNFRELSKRENFIDSTDSMIFSNKSEYPRLKKFKNIYNNKRCFIVGNGPSLQMMDLDKIHENNEISFGVNSIYTTSDKVNWRPNAYVVSDVNYANLNFQNFLKFNTDYTFITDAANIFWSNYHNKDIYKFNSRADYGKGEIKISNDICKCIYTGATVIHSCIQIAMYMGIKEIYLIGTDTITYDRARELHNKSHFSEEYYQDFKHKLSFVPYLHVDRIISGFITIKTYAEENGIKIYNATRGGELEVFQRRSFDELF